MFYTEVKLFQDQKQSDAVLDNVSCILGCTRSSLNVVAAEKGVVVGRLVFSDNGDMIDCTKMGIGGNNIVICVYGVSRFGMLICKRFACCCDYLFIVKISIHKLFPA
ncbi:putative DNA topoisomerase (ATP-hydrolyzing) [Helianthus debilis subsp. tardiflorus]